MVKKSKFLFLGLISLVFILTFSFLISAADTNATSSNVNLGNFENSSKCLKSQIDSVGYSNMGVEELAFSLLALGYDSSRQSDLKTELEKRKSSSQDCWPSSGCTLRETSIVMLAYMHINKDVAGIKNWLMNQTASATDLTWYLQIETNNQSSCKINYDNSSRSSTINIDNNKKLSGSSSTCLRFAQDNYWLEIDSRCYDKEFEITCDSDFLVSTFYKKRAGDTYYMTASATQTTSPNNKIYTKIDSLCFKQAGICNYEGSLWATYAINKKDANIRTKLLPYLIALSQDSSTQRYFPSAFLYAITGFNEYLTTLSNLQNSKGYWQISDTSRRYYDTGIALMALAGRSGSSTQADTAIQYLLDPSVQSSGCWGGGNIRDTAIIFYSANPKPAHNGGTDPTLEQCSDYHSQGYSCSTRGDCEELNGTDLPNFNCYGGLICCSKSAVEKTCSEKGGAICSVNEECSGLTDTALGTSSCCLSGQCDPKTQQTNTCEENNYDCKSICSSDEEEDSSYTCSGSEVCCTPSTVTPPAKSYWWLYLLIILIILVVLAILFRNQLKMWWFKMTNKVEKTPIQPQTRPGYPPMMPPRPMQRPPMPMGNMPRRIIPGQPPQQVGPRPIMRPFPKEKELDETLKKLKDMGGNK